MKLHAAPWLAALVANAALVACAEESVPLTDSTPTVNATFDAGTSPPTATADSGTAAADAAAASAPTLGEHPRDRTVVAGRNAAFSVGAQGTNLGYVWERSDNHGSTWSVVGSTLPEHVVNATRATAAPAGGDDGARLRVTVANSLGSITSNPARLNVIALDASARVYTQHSSTVLWEHDVSTMSGPDWMATADLAAGKLTARSDGTNEQQSAYSGIHTIRLVNHHATTVTLAAGAVKVTYAGSYSHSAATGTSSSANSVVALSAAITPETTLGRVASLTHGVAMPAPNPSTTFKEETFGSTIVIQQESATAIAAELRLGELVIPPGQSLTLSFTMTTAATQSIADFTATGARLSVKLPPGIHFDDSSSVPLAWVTN